MERPSVRMEGIAPTVDTNLSLEAPCTQWGEVTATAEQQPSNITAAAEESDKGARRWTAPRLWWREDQQSNGRQPTEHRASQIKS